MKTIIKSLLVFLLFIILVIYSILHTKTGNKLAYFYISDRISEKSHIDVKVLSLNFYQYPEFTGEMLVEEDYKVNINGVLSLSNLDLDYAVTSSCISSNICRIDDHVDIHGKIYGKTRDFKITGEGNILDGTLVINGTKKRHDLKDIDLVLSDINSTKFFDALDQEPLLKGKSNVHLHFDTLNKKRIKGQITSQMVDNNYSGLDMEVTLDTKINIHNKKYTFTMDMATPTATAQVREGEYDQESKHGTAKYTLDVKELADIEKITEVDAVGPFYASGNLTLDKKIKMKGISGSFGGMMHIAYADKKFHFDLIDVPFNNIMQRLKQDPLLDAKMMGTIDYNVQEKEMNTHVKLKDVKFLQKELVELVQEKFGHDLNQEVFPLSSFDATYKKKVLSSYLKIANSDNYLIFKDTKLDSIEKSIDTTIDFEIQKHKITGKLYARNDGHARHTLDTYLTFDGMVEKHYKVKLDGPISKKWINMNYTLSAARLPSLICTIEDDINITGSVSGPFKRLYITGEGEALNGHIDFNTLKVYNELKDLNIKMTHIHAKKLNTLLGQPDLPGGKATVEAHLKYLNKAEKKGTLSYTLRNATYETLPLELTSDVNIEDDLYSFTGDIDLNNTKIKLSKGKFDALQKKGKASYTLDVKDLKSVEPLLGDEYKGSFFARGEVHYNNDALYIRGLSKSLGGMVDFLYKDDILYVDFENTSFKDILNLLDYPLLLGAKTNGSLNYDFKKELLLLNTKLDDARFLPSDLVKKAHKTVDVNLLYETFDASILDIKSQNNIITGRLKLSNLKNHIYLSNVNINTKSKKVDAYFDVILQNREFTGKVYGSLDKPKVNLDMQRLIKHEMDRQIDSMGGKAPREMMESMPMGGVAKDVAAGVGAGFVGMFF